MLYGILGVIAGNLLWTALWFGYNALLGQVGLLPADSSSRVEAPLPLLLLLVGSALFSLIAGYVTTAIGRAGYKPALALAVVQVAIGIFVQSQFWALMPIWYQLLFLLLLAPVTLLGARWRLT
jgi:hypothetical protein